MKLIEPSFEILFPSNLDEGIKSLKFIERMARISHRSEEKQTEESWRRFIEAVVLSHGDWSVVEHQHASVLFNIDRGVSHELVRHRMFSYTQESTRFVNYKKVGEISVMRPENLLPKDESVWTEAISKSCWAYTVLMERGARPQMARSVLPNALATRISMTGNLRSWRWLFLARCSQETHPDMRRIMDPLLAEFKKYVPLLFDDIEVGLKQSVSMGKVH